MAITSTNGDKVLRGLDHRLLQIELISDYLLTFGFRSKMPDFFLSRKEVTKLQN